MTTKLEQVARQALEALIVAEEFVNRHSEDWYISGQQDLKKIRESITALQEALAEPQVDWKEEAMRLGGLNAKHVGELRKLKTEQAEQEPTVSDGVCGGCAKKAADGWALYCVECWEKAVVKKSLTAQEQEPMAWAYIDADGSFMDALDRQHGAYQTPLYAAPVRTKDLTDDDKANLVMEHLGTHALTDGKMSIYEAFLLGVEKGIAADREKNK